MARAKSTDFLHSFRFHVVVTGFGPGSDPKLGTLSGQQVSAGFSSCSTPEVSHDAVEYREGHYIYSKKYVGLPTVSDITLSRGVALTDGAMWAWMKDVIEGNAEYRANLSILHFHRDAKPQSTSGSTNTEMPIKAGPTDPGYVEYRCSEAFPVRHKVANDLDATASEVSIQELDMAIEYFDVIRHPSV